MSSSTALLPKDRKSDHPIFLRICHSPWMSIGQKVLVGLRGVTFAYLVISFFMILDYEIERNDHGWLTVFEFSNVAYFLQLLYQGIAFSWTFMHLHYPHHGSQPRSAATNFQKLMSPPRQNNSSGNKHWFSIFYYAANTFPLVSAFIHWVILVPKGKSTIPGDQSFNQDWFTSFFVFSKFISASTLAIIETFVYSSVRRPDPLWANATGISTLSALYTGWTYIGYVVTDKYGYYFFDHKQVGWEYVFASWAGFVALSNFFLVFIYGITALREKLSKKSDNKNSGYQQLPQ